MLTLQTTGFAIQAIFNCPCNKTDGNLDIHAIFMQYVSLNSSIIDIHINLSQNCLSGECKKKVGGSSYITEAKKCFNLHLIKMAKFFKGSKIFLTS